MSGHSGAGIVFNVQNIILQPVNDPVPPLFNIFCVADVAFQEINKIIALTVGLHYGVVFNPVMQVNYYS